MKEKTVKQIWPKARDKTKQAYSASDAALRRSYHIWKSRSELFSLRRKRNQKLKELGEQAFKLLSGGQLDPGELAGFKEAIVELERQIRDKEAAIAQKRGRSGPAETGGEPSSPVAEPGMPEEVKASPERPPKAKGEESAA